MAAKRLVLLGAGMTGRGQVAQLAADAGWDLTLVDSDAALVRRLQQAGRYTVQLLGDATAVRQIDGYRALHVGDSEALAAAVHAADLVVTSVLEPNLPAAAATLAAALGPRLADPLAAPLNIIAAENMSDSSTVLAGYVATHLDPALWAGRVAFPNSMIARVVPVAADPLHILTEAYSEWTADRLTALAPLPDLSGLEWVDNQAARLQRKLFIHNAGHAVCGYLGWLRRHRLIDQAARDPEVMAAVRAAVAEAGAAISAEHGFPRETVSAYERNLCERLVIDTLPDDIRRVIRQPLRKLGIQERLLGPLQLCLRHGLPCHALCRGIAAVLACRLEGDEQFDRLAATVGERGAVGALTHLTGYQPPPTVATAIAAAWSELAPGGA